MPNTLDLQAPAFIDARSNRSRLNLRHGHMPSFADILNDVREMLVGSNNLYLLGREEEALDSSLHRIVEFVESRDNLSLSATFQIMENMVSNFEADDLPRTIDLWIGAAAVSRHLRDDLPARSKMITTLRQFVQQRMPDDKARQLLRNID